MNLKYINYSLLIILFSIIIAILIEEVNYNRFGRNDWETNIEVDINNEPVKIINGYYSNRDMFLEFPTRDNYSKLIFHNTFKTYGESVVNQLPPDSINIKWFSYPDNKFYYIKEKVSTEKISEYIQTKNLTNYKLITNFRKGSKVDLYIMNNSFNEKDSLLIDSFTGKKYETAWEFGNDRASDVYIMNSKVIMFPEIDIKSHSKFRELEIFYSNETSFETDSLIYIFPANAVDIKEKGPFNRFSLDLENKLKYKDQLLNIYVKYSNKELAKILSELSKEEISCTIKLNSLDSIESIYLRDSTKKFYLKEYKTYYELQTDYKANQLN